MNKDIVKEIIYILVAVIVGILVFKFLIWLLPIIIVGIVAYLIYKSIKKNKYDVNVNKGKNKKMKVIHDLDDKD